MTYCEVVPFGLWLVALYNAGLHVSSPYCTNIFHSGSRPNRGNILLLFLNPFDANTAISANLVLTVKNSSLATRFYFRYVHLI